MHRFVQAELLLCGHRLRARADVDPPSMARCSRARLRHTATMHSTNIDNLSRMAKAVNTSIFVKNGPSLAGLASRRGTPQLHHRQPHRRGPDHRALRSRASDAARQGLLRIV
jgi:hypothetical protein